MCIYKAHEGILPSEKEMFNELLERCMCIVNALSTRAKLVADCCQGRKKKKGNKTITLPREHQKQLISTTSAASFLMGVQ